ncbi:fatty acid synthesis protein [Campylobacter concisus]|nr:fatty acid synthesis protein [Campylobacter concisus]
MVIINAILGGLILSYATAVLYIINFIYSKFNFVVDYVNNLPTGNDKILTTALSFIKSLGAWNALCDVMAIFSPIFLSFFLIYATKIGIVVFKFVRETILSFVVAKS